MKRTISLNKRKIFFLLLLVLGFTALGGYLYRVAELSTRYNTLFIKVPLAVLAIVFGLMSLYLIYRMVDWSPGLTLNSDGIYDNSSVLAAGFIPWKEIKGIDVTEVSGQRIIAVRIRNPRRIINRARFPNTVLMRANNNWYGSPVLISENGLHVEFDQLYSLLNEYFRRYGSQ